MFQKLQTIGEDFCGLDVNTPLGGEQPISAVPVLQFSTRLTAVAATSTGDFTVVFVGTDKGHLKKVGTIIWLSICSAIYVYSQQENRKIINTYHKLPRMWGSRKIWNDLNLKVVWRLTTERKETCSVCPSSLFLLVFGMVDSGVYCVSSPMCVSATLAL